VLRYKISVQCLGNTSLTLNEIKYTLPILFILNICVQPAILVRNSPIDRLRRT